jgi:enoyl-CoA hydratase
MAYETLLLSVADHVAVLTLNRPEAMNAITQRMKDELAAALDAVEGDDAARVLVITGAGGKAFCAGADIKERAGSDPTPAEFLVRQRATHRLFTRIEHFAKPVIAALNGVAYGGGAEIALCADIRIAADSAMIGLTEVNLGVIPAGGGTQRLPRLVGAGMARKLLFTGDRVKADEALRIGLVDEVVPAAGLLEHCRKLALRIAERGPLAVATVKKAVNYGLNVDLPSGCEYEITHFGVLCASADQKEGCQAFLEKRKPNFTGR